MVERCSNLSLKKVPDLHKKREAISGIGARRIEAGREGGGFDTRGV